MLRRRGRPVPLPEGQQVQPARTSSSIAPCLAPSRATRSQRAEDRTTLTGRSLRPPQHAKSARARARGARSGAEPLRRRPPPGSVTIPRFPSDSRRGAPRGRGGGAAGPEGALHPVPRVLSHRLRAGDPGALGRLPPVRLPLGRQRPGPRGDAGRRRGVPGPLRRDPVERPAGIPRPAALRRLRRGYAVTGLEDAVLVVRTRIERTPVVLAFMAETAERHPSRRKRTARSAPDQEATGARCSPTEIPSIPRDRSRQTALSTIHGRLTTMVLYKPFPAPAYRLFRLTKRFRNSGPALFAL